MVIIMTRRETVHLYGNLLSGCEMVESQLLPCITEHLTAEIIQSTVSDITRAIEWMKCSYLYVRMKKACLFLADSEDRLWYSFVRSFSESFNATIRILRIIQFSKGCLATE
ncbi:DNA helicase [Handroanthus impetiginosus]|uniref:DNA 3'-5' helicase n=1 Tax=Handroanthus impetiginosus TaxID=429701 RepID=A0A2G9GI57_9LAMI|nr:DNA helicase [Handroanthus impetiginosus]